MFFGARCCYLQHLLFVAIFGAAFNILKPAICSPFFFDSSNCINTMSKFNIPWAFQEMPRWPCLILKWSERGQKLPLLQQMSAFQMSIFLDLRRPSNSRNRVYVRALMFRPKIFYNSFVILSWRRRRICVSLRFREKRRELLLISLTICTLAYCPRLSQTRYTYNWLTRKCLILFLQLFLQILKTFASCLRPSKIRFCKATSSNTTSSEFAEERGKNAWKIFEKKYCEKWPRLMSGKKGKKRARQNLGKEILWKIILASA